MMQRNLTITLESDWKAAMRATAKLAKAKTFSSRDPVCVMPNSFIVLGLGWVIF